MDPGEGLRAPTVSTWESSPFGTGGQELDGTAKTSVATDTAEKIEDM
jgi:hypothetical protein